MAVHDLGGCMRWFVNFNGSTQGPAEEANLARLIKKGGMDGAFVRDEHAQVWMPIGQSPFGALLQRRPKRSDVALQTNASVPAAAAQWTKKIHPGFHLILWIIGLLILSIQVGALGIILGIALIGWGDVSRRWSKQSFVSALLKKPSSERLSIATMGLGLAIMMCAAIGIVGETAEPLQQAGKAQASQAESRGNLPAAPGLGRTTEN